MKNNSNFIRTIIQTTDSYKVSHWKQLPQNTSRIFSFFESRSQGVPELTFFGLQYFLKEYLSGQVVTQEGIAYAREMFAMHFGTDKMFNEDMWQHILRVHDGRLPLEIRAVPEGTVLPTRNALMTVVNTDPKCASLTNYMETLLSQIWYPCTIATRSREMKKTILKYLEKTGTPEDVDFKLVDFGYRGSTSVESAGIGAAAHLLSFKVTDTLAGIDIARFIYNEPMAGFSIPAAEHSTITSWGREHEVDAYRNMLQSFPEGKVAVVSDSYNVYDACEKMWGGELREEVLTRNGVLIIRPDSGYPPEVVLKVLAILGEKFGCEPNQKGYKVLDPHVRIIQGDGIDPEMIEKILSCMEAEGWSADNIAFGSGGGLLQKVDRDTYKFAFKCSAACVDDEWRDVMKDPITDAGKKSKAGRLELVKYGDKQYQTVRAGESSKPNELVPVFYNGEILREYTFSEIRERSKIS